MNIKKYIQITLFIITTSASINGFSPLKNTNQEQNQKNGLHQPSDKDNTHWLEKLKTQGSERLEESTTDEEREEEREIAEELEQAKIQAFQDFLQNPTMHPRILQVLEGYESNIKELDANMKQVKTTLAMFVKIEKAFQPNPSKKTLEEGFVAFQDYNKLLLLEENLMMQRKQEEEEEQARIAAMPQHTTQLDQHKENLRNSDKPNLLKTIETLQKQSNMKWLR
jgi:hypothetical protein